MKKIFTLLFISYNFVIYTQPQPVNFYKRFEGAINGKYNITVNLVRIDSALSGNYYYNNKGELINFIRSSIDSAGNVYLEEDAGYDENYNSVTTGIFKGLFVQGNRIEGIWEKPGSDKALPFYLEERYPAGCAQLNIIHNSGNYSDYGHASIEITQIELKKYEIEKVQNEINKQLKAAVLKDVISFDENKHYTSVDEAIDDFIDAYKTEIVEDSVNYSDHIPQYEYSSITEILFNSAYLLSLQKIDYSYLGGAHPNTYIRLMNFDLNNGRRLKLDDIFKSNYTEALNKIGEVKFREYYKLEAGQPLDSAGFWFEKGFQLNENFSLTKAGISFLFNAYEIGPYVLGAPEVYIPFSEIKDLIKENSIIGSIRK